MNNERLKSLSCELRYKVLPTPVLENLADEEQLKIRKGLKKVFDNWSNIKSTYPW